MVNTIHRINLTRGPRCYDCVVIKPTRWKLRSAIRIVNEVLNVLKVEKHSDKTFIGKVERGFDFLGYFLKPKNDECIKQYN